MTFSSIPELYREKQNLSASSSDYKIRPGRLVRTHEELPAHYTFSEIENTVYFKETAVPNFATHFAKNELLPAVVLDSEEALVENDVLRGQMYGHKLGVTALAFANLHTESDIEAFAQTYGLLGVRQQESFKLESCLSLFEPVSFWKKEMKEFQRMLKLYKFHLDQLEERDIYKSGNYRITTVEYSGGTETHLTWFDGKFFYYDKELRTLRDEFKNPIGISLASYIVSSYISLDLKMSGIIHPAAEQKMRARNDKYKEDLRTSTLLSAIYIDLWEMMKRGTPIEYCHYEACRTVFQPANKRQRFCSNACKQANYRKKQS
ncbi:hypothetical protein B0H94_1202 [Salsuginibacillus halophilus]|uniref:Uncharacterized protein n=1 Tax=Salsuginibacillus halophilus TaxID=517424 RepID=A0A2P8H4V2_9BACI|nr:hypothetical protein [Salsuginibacillus halophilus]PSL41256.1 hypothetical protein B0H94_1202 [Salsuginibacillus halophilus]